MSERIVWGIDVGGTKTALCAADEAGHILCRRQLATGDFMDWRMLLDELIAWGVSAAPQPVAIGVSCGGPLDSRKGLILNPPNLPGWHDAPITDWLCKRTGICAYLQNDANACALAEWRYGAGAGCDSMVFLTFGTGLGAGLILNGRLYEGANGMAGEVGHIRMAEDGPEGYGKRGSLEGFCSGGGLQKLANIHMGEPLTAREIIARADQGDAQAMDVLRICARTLGRGLAILIDVLNPQRIIIGSIFARAQRHFRDEMEASLKSEALGISLAACEVLPAALGDDIGDIAAITVAWNGLKGV